MKNLTDNEISLLQQMGHSLTKNNAELTDCAPSRPHRTIPPQTLRIGFCACMVSALILGCSSLDRQEKMEAAENPMPKIWSNIESSINDLETSRATPSQWTAVAESSDTILSENQLLTLLPFKTSETIKINNALSNFRNAEKVIHFGFEANHHAVVFFSANKTTSLIKW